MNQNYRKKHAGSRSQHLSTAKNRGRLAIMALSIAISGFSLDTQTVQAAVTAPFLAAEFVIEGNQAEPALPTPTNTPTPIPPTATFTPTFTPTPLPPADTATNTPTPIPPTATYTPTFTPTPLPPTDTATNTPTYIPPTNTATRTPFFIPPTATNTPLPPTNTPTPLPTRIRPTKTSTSIPPTATQVEITVEEQIDQLIFEVQALGFLKNSGDQMLKSLNGAREKFEDFKYTGTVGKINGFIARVYRSLTKGEIDQTTADSLIAAAQEIVESINEFR